MAKRPRLKRILLWVALIAVLEIAWFAVCLFVIEPADAATPTPECKPGAVFHDRALAMACAASLPAEPSAAELKRPDPKPAVAAPKPGREWRGPHLPETIA